MEGSHQTHRTALRAILILSLLINAFLAYSVVTVYFGDSTLPSQFRAVSPREESLRSQVESLEQKYNLLQSQLQYYGDENENLTRQLESLKQRYDILENQLEYYKAQAEYYSNLTSVGKVYEGVTGRSTVNVVAVRAVPSGFFEYTYEGVTMTAEVELKSGEGRVLINTEPRVGIDLQTSMRTAALVAGNITGISLDRTDIILTVKAAEETDVVDGPSAGVAITAAMIAAVKNETLNMRTYVTGTVKPDGTVGPVGGVLEKALAAAKREGAVFLVPPGLSVIKTYEYETKEIAPGFTVTVMKPRYVGLEEYLGENGYEVKVLEVKTVSQAYDLLAEKR